MAGLEIVWRKPDPPHHQQRWEQLTAESQASLYEIQEFVSLTDGGFWSASSRLKVLAGGRGGMAERPETQRKHAISTTGIRLSKKQN